MVRHQDPMFMKRRLQVPEAAGRNILTVLCCNYWLVKTIAEPFMSTSQVINVISLIALKLLCSMHHVLLLLPSQSLNRSNPPHTTCDPVVCAQHMMF